MGYSPERRAHRRMQVLLAVELISGETRELARVLDVSAGGLRIQVSPAFEGDERIAVRRGEVTIPGRIAWRSGTTLGIQFDEVIDEHAFLKFRNPRHRCPACDRLV